MVGKSAAQSDGFNVPSYGIFIPLIIFFHSPFQTRTFVLIFPSLVLPAWYFNWMDAHA
jgi:hypothetical protein